MEVKHSRAVIYCRVSDKKQRSDGDGLHSQEHRSRQYSADHGYLVEDDRRIFRGDVSGGGDCTSRPGMVALLKYLDKHARGGSVVIFDDLKRFARDTVLHLKLRQELAARTQPTNAVCSSSALMQAPNRPRVNAFFHEPRPATSPSGDPK